MPRSSRSGGSRSAPAGSRGTHTMASSRSSQPQQQQHPYPHQQSQHQQAPVQQQSKGSGLFGQMASTAAGVAVGSSIGHGISNMFGGGGSVEPAPAPESQSNANLNGQGLTCEMQSKDFLRCLDATNNNMDSCAYYLDQLKACQAAARPF